MAKNAVDQRIIEQVEILAGYRPRNQQDAAVRIKDLDKALAELEARILETLRREFTPPPSP